MDKERILRIPKEILVKSAKLVIRKSSTVLIIGGSAGAAFGITRGVLGGDFSIYDRVIGFGILATGVGLDINKMGTISAENIQTFK